MSTDDFVALDATAQAELVARGDVSPPELVDAAIARIEALNPALNAVITPLYDKARAAATGPLPAGPFRGVPMLLKDLACHSAGDPMYEGMAFLRDAGWVEQEDTHLAAAFRAAGFVCCGKTNTPELGIVPGTEPLAFGPSRNPWDVTRSTGGSSGGSAAAVASGMVPVAHANDAGGSIRIPASECGLVGLKPSRARTSLGPDYGDVFGGLVAEHVLTRSVRDSAAVLDAVAGPHPGDPYAAPAPRRPFLDEVGADPGRLRIGVMTAQVAGNAAPAPDCVAAVEGARRLLQSLGHDVRGEHPAALDDSDYTPHFVDLYVSGVAWSMEYWGRKLDRPVSADDVEPTTWAIAEMGRAIPAPRYLYVREWLQAWSRRLASWWTEGFDLLVTPTCAEPPPPLGEFTSTPDNPLGPLLRATPLAEYTAPFNTSGQPAISLPLHWTTDGLPVGVQFVAPYGREDLLLRVAAQLELAQPWADRWPPVSAAASI